MHAESQYELKKWECEGGFGFGFWIFFLTIFCAAHTKHAETLAMLQAGAECN